MLNRYSKTNPPGRDDPLKTSQVCLGRQPAEAFCDWMTIPLSIFRTVRVQLIPAVETVALVLFEVASDRFVFR